MRPSKYRTAEQALFEASGIEPEESWIRLSRIGTKARVLTGGDGPPAVFFNGGPNAAATWSYVAAALPDVRWHLVDRPGTGLSEPPPAIPDRTNVADYVVDFGLDALDGLGLDRATMVGSSFGGYATLRLAASHPTRVERLILVACPAFVPGWTGPKIATLLRTPILGPILMHAPPTRASVRMSLRQFGHSEALAAGSIPDAMIDWIVAWQRHTETMRHDGRMIIGCGTWRGGFDPELDLTERELGAVAKSTTILIGTADTVGGVDVARRLAAAMPSASVDTLTGSGHLPWLDNPRWVAERITAAVRGAPTGQTGTHGQWPPPDIDGSTLA